MKLLILNGPNLNLLGQREPEIYGSATYHDLLALIQETAQRLGLKADVRQSNHEGIPTVEVHLSDLKTREPFRQISYIRPACAATFMGLGIEGYRRGMEFLEGKIRQELHT